MSISELDMGLTMEILSRLPVKTIFACRCVCNTWKLILSHPQFAKLHVSRTPANLLYLPDDDESSSSSSSTLHVIDVRGLESRPGRCYHNTDVLKLNLRSHLPVSDESSGRSAFSTLHSYSCNGLLCLLDLNQHHPTYVCNPLLSEYIAIPKPRKGKGKGRGGFGFCSVTNQYKVIWSHSDAPYETLVYTLGDRKWRSIGNAPFNFPFLEDHKILVNGTVHWIHGAAVGFYIRGFSFDSEQFLEIPGPSELALHEDASIDYPFLGELGGCLSLQLTFGVGNPRTLEIWVLKESWTKDFVIDVSLFGDSCEYFIPIMIMESGDILMWLYDIALVLYSPYWRSFRSLTGIYDFKYPFAVVAHIPSFISLKDVAKGEKVKTICQD